MIAFLPKILYHTSMWIREGIFLHIGSADKDESNFFESRDLVIDMLFFVSVSKTFSWLLWLFPDPLELLLLDWVKFVSFKRPFTHIYPKIKRCWILFDLIQIKMSNISLDNYPDKLYHYSLHCWLLYWSDFSFFSFA